MGFVDRGGGREAKGASLRRSKKNPGAPAAKKASAPKQQQSTARVAPTFPRFTDDLLHVDAAVAILARKLDADRDVLMRRAAQESGVAAAVTWCGDFERQAALVEFCTRHNVTTATATPGDGTLYCIVGVHVNNVDRMHKKVQESWVESVASWGKHPEVLGLLSGLNLERDSGTHFAQEWLLEQLWYTAGALQMPLVLHICHDTQRTANGDGAAACNPTVDRAAELLAELMARQENGDDETKGGTTRKSPTSVVLYNGIGALACSSAMRALVKRCVPPPPSAEAVADTNPEGASVAPPIYILATAEGLIKSDGSTSAVEDGNGVADAATYIPSYVETLCNDIALSQLLIGTGAPWNTPQNIPDKHLRTLPNEPANYGYVVAAIHDALSIASQEPSLGLQEVYTAARDNFLRAFFPAESPTQQPEGLEQEQSAIGEDATLDAVAPAQAQTVHLDPLVTTSTDAVPVAPDSTRYYLCLKCRRRLFHEHSLLTHPLDAAQAHFGGRHARTGAKNSKRAASGASCESVCFLAVMDTSNGEWGVAESGLLVNRMNGTVSCSGCCSKLGTAGDDVCCPCGCAVAGRTARLAASKVEAPLRQEVSGDLESLLVQAAREREELLQEQLGAARRGECSESDDGDERRKKEPKKNVKANNRSNFTHFRNKNFAPRLPSHGGTLDSGNGDKDRQSNDEDEYETHEELTQQTGRRKNKRKGARRKDDEATATQPAGTP